MNVKIEFAKYCLHTFLLRILKSNSLDYIVLEKSCVNSSSKTIVLENEVHDFVFMDLFITKNKYAQHTLPKEQD
nr:unnamed protein product [Callosobruchus chinensis]